MTSLEIAVIWIACGMAGLGVIIVAGNQKPISVAASTAMIAGGPLTLTLSSAFALTAYDTGCAFHCSK